MMRFRNLVLASTLSGCAVSGADDVLGVPDPGALARLVLVTGASRGGGAYTTTTLVIDSITAGFEETICQERALAPPCSDGLTRRSGIASRALLDQLYADTRAPAFRRLASSYEPQVRPPDGSGSTLTITGGERTRIISWHHSAKIPAVLPAFACRLQAVTGTLVNCAISL
jgi:hypothetical protein